MKLAICGGYRVGKTYLAESLTNTEYQFTHKALADPLKVISASRHPHLAPAIFAEEKTSDTRKLLNKVSEDFKNRFGRDCFAKFILDNTDSNNIVISDVRFKEEADTLKAAGFKFIWVGPEDNNYDLQYCRENLVSKILPSKPDISNVIETIDTL